MFWWKEERTTINPTTIIWCSHLDTEQFRRHKLKTHEDSTFSCRRGWEEWRKHTYRRHRHTNLSSIFYYIFGKVKGVGGKLSLKGPEETDARQSDIQTKNFLSPVTLQLSGETLM